MLPLRFIRQPYRRAVLDLRPMAISGEKGKSRPGAVLQIVGFTAGSLPGNGGVLFTEAAAGLILYQTVFRDHQGQAAVDNGLRRQNLLNIPQLGKPQLKGQAGGGQPFLPQIIQRTAVEYVQAEIAVDPQPAVPQDGQVADVPSQRGGDAQRSGVGQPLAELRFVPISPHTGQNGAPFPGKLRQSVPLCQQLQRNIETGRGQGQQRFRLRPCGDGDRQFRRFGGTVRIRQRGELQLPTLRHGAACLLQRGQRVPPQGIYRPGGEKQAVLHLRGAVRTAEGRAAGLLQAGFQIGGRQRLVLRRFRHGAADRDRVAVLVPNRQGGRLP